MDMAESLRDAEDTMDIIKVTYQLYNEVADTYFERQHGSLEKVLAVTLEELAEFSWQDYLDEEALNGSLETYLDKVSENMTSLDQMASGEDQEEKGQEEQKKRVLVVDEKALQKMYSYVERNYGKTFLQESEEKRLN